LLALLGRLKSAMATVADEHDLTLMQMHALYTIMSGQSTMGQLASSLHCDASNVTGIVDRLVARGLVTSQTAPHDRRTKVLKVSAHAQTIIESFVNELSEHLGCPQLSQVEGEQLHDTILKLVAAR
jgi:DNA-binding MarR family transcriptional regulator